MENYHFWYSNKQAMHLSRSDKPAKINHAKINGQTVVYTACSPTKNHGCFWDDMVYLGQGSYINVDEGNW